MCGTPYACATKWGGYWLRARAWARRVTRRPATPRVIRQEGWGTAAGAIVLSASTGRAAAAGALIVCERRERRKGEGEGARAHRPLLALDAQHNEAGPQAPHQSQNIRGDGCTCLSGMNPKTRRSCWQDPRAVARGGKCAIIYRTVGPARPAVGPVSVGIPGPARPRGNAKQKVACGGGSPAVPLRPS